MKKLDDAWFARGRPTSVADFNPYATPEERREARRPVGFATLADLAAAYGGKVVKASEKTK